MLRGKDVVACGMLALFAACALVEELRRCRRFTSSRRAECQLKALLTQESLSRLLPLV